MTKINDGGSAYPTMTVSPYGNTIQGGMSLRDYFAAQALMGLCANSVPGSHHSTENRVRDAYEIADAMIAERNKDQPK